MPNKLSALISIGASKAARMFFTDDDTELADRFPWYTPSKTKVEAGELELFPELITDAELEKRYERYQLVKVIINDVVEDSLRNGFIVENVDSPDDMGIDKSFQKVWDSFLKPPFMKSIKFCRLYGYSSLYFGYGDTGNPLEQPPTEGTLIKWLLPLSKPQFELSITEDLPREIEFIRVMFSEDDGTNIDPSRFIHMENEALTDDYEGMSVLSPVWDLLSVQKNSDWSIGQDLFRGAAGLLTLFSPPGTTSANGVEALNAIDNLHAKSKLVLPPGFDAKDLSPTRVGHRIKDLYEIICHQISVGTRIPAFMLYPHRFKKTGESTEDYEGFLFSYQEAFLGPLLRKCFEKFQKSGQLPEGDFKILWKPAHESPYEASKAKIEHLKALTAKYKQENSISAVEVTPLVQSEVR